MANAEHARHRDTPWRATQETPGWAAKHGSVGGIVGGIIFAMAEMVGGSVISGNPFLMPLKMIASIITGTMPPTISASTGVLVGLITHMVLSILFGVVFALIVARVSALRDSSVATVVAASVYGFVLWVLNFYILAPILNRPWFKETPVGQQFVYHAFFFGTVLGVYLVAALRHARDTVPAGEERMR